MSNIIPDIVLNYIVAELERLEYDTIDVKEYTNDGNVYTATVVIGSTQIDRYETLPGSYDEEWVTEYERMTYRIVMEDSAIVSCEALDDYED